MKKVGRFLLFFILIGNLPFYASAAEHKIPNYTLVNQDGKEFTLHSLKGKHLLLSFFTTECSEFNECHKTVALNKYMQYFFQFHPKKKLSFNFLFLSLNRENDTPQALARFALERSLVEKDFIFATADAKTLDQIASGYNVLIIPPKEKKPFRHTVKTILFDPELNKVKELLGALWGPNDILVTLPQ